MKKIESYLMQDVIGAGQYGKVYKALDERTNTFVAIKMVKSQKFKEISKLEEFTMNEIQTLSKIENRNIVKFIEMLKTSNHYYFVYEFCNGGNLEQRIASQSKFSEKEVNLKK